MLPQGIPCCRKTWFFGSIPFLRQTVESTTVVAATIPINCFVDPRGDYSATTAPVSPFFALVTRARAGYIFEYRGHFFRGAGQTRRHPRVVVMRIIRVRAPRVHNRAS